MSALPPKADQDVCFGPIPDIPSDCNGTVSSTTILMSEFSDRYLWY